MCGVLAFVGNKENEYDVDKIKLLYTYNTLERGEDAIGIYTPIHGLHKKAGKPVNLLPKMSLKADKLLIGHVRSGTVGINNDENAHPFQHGTFIGAMNGTTTNHWGLCDKYELNREDFNVDSDIIFAIIAKAHSFDVLGEIKGGCAALMHDTTKPDLLYVYRNKDRPLFRGHLNNDMYISSIEESLAIIGCTKVEEFKENFLYTIKDGKILGSPIKIKQNPFETGPDISGKFQIVGASIKNNLLVNRYVQFDSPNFPDLDSVKHFTMGNWYLCTGFSHKNEWEIRVINDLNQTQLVSFFAFNYTASFPMEGHPLRVLDKLTITKKKTKEKTVLFEKDDLCILVKYSNKSVVVKRTADDDSEWLLPFSSVRPMSFDEKNTEYFKIVKLNEVKPKSPKPPLTLPMPPVLQFPEDDIAIDTGCDIFRGSSALPPWRDSLETNPNEINEVDEEEDFDEAYVYIPVKDLEVFVEQVRYGLRGINASISEASCMGSIKSDIKARSNEIEEYIDREYELFSLMRG